MKFDIIVVHYGNKQDTERTIGSIVKNTQSDYRLTVFDNSINNRGWVWAANRGLDDSTAPFVVLCNNDIEILTPDWLNKMAEPFNSVEHLGAVNPIHPTIGYRDIKRNAGFVELIPSFKPFDMHIVFYCAMLNRDCIKEIGHIDPQFGPHGLDDDDDWMARAYLAGWRCGLQTDVFVDHFRTGIWHTDSTRINLEKLNHEKLLKKYSHLMQ